MSPTREITLRPSLLAYQDTIVIDGVTLTLDVEYRVRDADWWLSILDAQGAPIAECIRVTIGRPIPAGVYDARLPPGGVFFAVRLEEGDFSHPGPGELGDAVRLLWLTRDDVLAQIGEEGGSVDYLAIAKVKSITAVS